MERTLESKDFNLNITKTRCMECSFRKNLKKWKISEHGQRSKQLVKLYEKEYSKKKTFVIKDSIIYNNKKNRGTPTI